MSSSSKRISIQVPHSTSLKPLHCLATMVGTGFSQGLAMKSSILILLFKQPHCTVYIKERKWTSRLTDPTFLGYQVKCMYSLSLFWRPQYQTNLSREAIRHLIVVSPGVRRRAATVLRQPAGACDCMCICVCTSLHDQDLIFSGKIHVFIQQTLAECWLLNTSLLG